jgi:hypothetical protein
MEKRKEPTIKQKRAAEIAVENGGNISRAMREAGYSPATAKNPDKLTKSLAWQDLLEHYLPDDMLLDALSEDIQVKKGNRTPELTLAAKMKGRLTEKVDVTTAGESLTKQFSDEEKANLLALL